MNSPGRHPFDPDVAGAAPQPGSWVSGAPLQPTLGRAGRGGYVLVTGLASIGMLTAAAMLTGVPLIFPSLGPTAYLQFSDPYATAAAPRNAVLGHLIGVGAGWGALAAFGLLDASAAAAMSITPARVAAAAVSLAVTGAVMVWLSLSHPPAAATTLIVSLGILHTTAEILVLVLAVVLLVAMGVVINRAAGMRVPRWSPPS